MDLEPDLKWAVRKVAQALHDYAFEHQWKKSDYCMDIVVNLDWGGFLVTFAAKQFQGQDGFQRFKEVQDYLEAKLKKYPVIVREINLIVKDRAAYLAENPFPVGPPDYRVPEEDLKPPRRRATKTKGKNR